MAKQNNTNPLQTIANISAIANLFQTNSTKKKLNKLNIQ